MVLEVGKMEKLKAAAAKAKQKAKEAPAGADSECCKTAKSVKLTWAGTVATKFAVYRMVAPERPPIRHDNGFLQNPNDPSDPDPMPTREPTMSDRASLLFWKAKLEAGQMFRDMPDALDAYRHFLYGNGADRTFSYERYVDGDPAGASALQSAIWNIQLAAEEFYFRLCLHDPSLKKKRVFFSLTGTAIGVGQDGISFPYPDTENWQKAIGAHVIWMSGDVEVLPASCCSDREALFKMRATLHAEDRYNFNPTQKDIATGIPDEENGRFELCGLAHQYMNYATLQRDVTWLRYDGFSGTVVKVGQ